MTKKYFSGLFTAGFVALSAGAASAATLIGDSVGCAVVPSNNFSCSAPTSVVGAGNEFSMDYYGNKYFDFDIGPSSVRLTQATQYGVFLFSEIVTFSGLDFSPTSTIVGIENFATNATGVELGDITFGDDWVAVDFRQTHWNTDQFVSFDLVTRQAGAVPLPAGLPLILTALGALGMLRRRSVRR